MSKKSRQDNPAVNRNIQNPDGEIVSQQWSGPLPPPAALENFNRIITKGADRIMTMVEQEQAHRIDIEKSIVRETSADTRRRNVLGALIALAAIAGSVYTAYIGAHPAVSVALVGLPIAAIIKTMIGGRSGD